MREGFQLVNKEFGFSGVILAQIWITSTQAFTLFSDFSQYLLHLLNVLWVNIWQDALEIPPIAQDPRVVLKENTFLIKNNVNAYRTYMIILFYLPPKE